MNIMEKLSAAANAVKAGESLTNPAAWKNVQMLMIPFSTLLALVPQFLPVEVSSAQINAIAYGLATLSVVVSTYLTAATSTKVGL